MRQNKPQGALCPIDVTCEDPVRALHVFAMIGCCQDVAALLDAGVDVDARDSAACTALARVAGGESSQTLTEIDAALSGGSGHANKCPEHKIWFEDIVKRYAYPEQGSTPLNPLPNRLEMIRLLVARGADTEARNSSGKTPIFFAAYTGDAEAVRLLLELGANPSATDKAGLSPLMAAMCEDKAAGRASVTSRDNSGNTLLSFAAAASCAGVVRLLLDAGADVLAKDNDVHSVCDRALGKGAILNGMTNSRGFFLSVLATHDLGLTPSKYKSVFSTILPFAVMDGNAEAVRAILQKARPTINSDTVRDAFYAAIVNGSFEMVRLLVELYGRKLIIPRRNSYDTTALGALLESDHPNPAELRYCMCGLLFPKVITNVFAAHGLDISSSKTTHTKATPKRKKRK